jgi:hypothetical protein
MSPEQLMGLPADGRSDIFAVGTVVYELLAYRAAFPGGIESGVITRIVQSTPEPLNQICGGLDAEIVRIVNRALAKEPSQRYQDLGHMVQELQRVRLRLDREPRSGDSDAPAPTPTPTAFSTMRRSADRDELARRRFAQIQSHLDAAAEALACGDADVAAARCEEALLLDADHPGASELFERARAAQDEQQASGLLGDAEAHIRLGALTAAQVLIERAGALCGSADRVASLRRTVDEALREREQARRRADAIERLLDRANGAFDWGDFTGAIEAAEQALSEQPDLAEAVSLRQRATDALAARERARDVIANPAAPDEGATDGMVLGSPEAAMKIPAGPSIAPGPLPDGPGAPTPLPWPALETFRLLPRRLSVPPRRVWSAALVLILVVASFGVLQSRREAPVVVPTEAARDAAADRAVLQHRLESRRLLVAGEMVGAADAAAAGLAIRQRDRELLSITGQILTAVGTRLEAARQEAAPLAGKKPPREFVQADARRAEFVQLQAAGSSREAVITGLDAAERFTRFADARRTSEERRVAQEKRERDEKARFEESERERLAIERTLAERDAIARQIAEAQAKKQAEEQSRAADERARRDAEEQSRREEQERIERVSAAEKARLARLEEDRRLDAERAAARAAASAEADRRAVDAVLRAYVQGYSDRSAGAVKRVFPSADERVLADRFASLRSQRVTVNDPSIDIDSQTATVSGQWIVESVDMFGQRQTGTVPFRLRMQKSGDSWVILARQ